MRRWAVVVDDGIYRSGEDPFIPPVQDRDAGRRFRGRLAAPVTVWTTFNEKGESVGLTVSSVVITDGDPPNVIGIMSPLTDFWEAMKSTGRFVLHVLPAGDRIRAEQFAGRGLRSDSLFDSTTITSDWGPILASLATYACCSVNGFVETGDSLVLRGVMDEIHIGGDLPSPLVHYHGQYFTLTAATTRRPS